ncbi:sugar transferase [Sphingomonas sp. RS2018]
MATSDTAIASRRWSMEQWRLVLYWCCLVLDCASIIIGFLLAGTLRDARGLAVEGFPLVIGAVPLFIALAIMCEAYTVECLQQFSESTRRAMAALGAMSFIIVAAAFFAQVGSVLSRLAFAYAILISGALILAGRIGVAAIVRWAFGGVVVKCVLIVDGAPVDAPSDCDIFHMDRLGLRPDLSDPDGVARISALVTPYDKIYLSAQDDRREAWITALKATGTSLELIIPIDDIHGAVGLGRFGQEDTLILSRGPLSLSSQIKKRIFDLALTIPMLVLIAPLLIAVALAIKIDSRGPVLFAQSRIGRGNKPFRIYKFRSMKVAQADAHGVVSAQRDDQRVTRVGRFIRTSSIDELPQLFNVLIGNMSLVGPRPHARGSTAGDQLFWEVSQRYWMRHASKPGITGLAQVRGYRGNTEKPEDLEARLRSDLEYVQHWSFWRDLTILFATVKVISHENAY